MHRQTEGRGPALPIDATTPFFPSRPARGCPRARERAQKRAALTAALRRAVLKAGKTFGQAAPELLETEYAREIWALYEAGELTPETVWTGRFARDPTAADVGAVLDHIEVERLEAVERQRRRAAAGAE